MNCLRVLSFGLVLGAPLVAQTQMSSPKGFLTKEGSSFCRYFGPYADGRQQFANGDFEGMKIMVSEVAVRLDNRDHAVEQTTGRSWADVTLNASECPIDALNVNLSAEWSKNSITTPTQVFSGAVTWPTQVGYPSASSAPAAWGGRKNRLRFAFSSPWSYNGKGGMLMDFQFSGGTLADNSAWGGASYSSYYLDGTAVATSLGGALTYFPPSSSCNDSAQTSSTGAYTSVSATVYARNHPTASNRGKLALGYFSGYTAPNATVVRALGGAGVPAGVDIGAACNKLYVDLSKPVVFVAAQTRSGSAFHFGPTFLVDWNAAFGGKEFWAQSAWADSKTGRLSLTRCRRAVIPNDLPPTIKRGMVYHYDKSLVSGFPPTDATNNMPLFRFTYK